MRSRDRLDDALHCKESRRKNWVWWLQVSEYSGETRGVSSSPVKHDGRGSRRSDRMIRVSVKWGMPTCGRSCALTGYVELCCDFGLMGWTQNPFVFFKLVLCCLDFMVNICGLSFWV